MPEYYTEHLNPMPFEAAAHKWKKISRKIYATAVIPLQAGRRRIRAARDSKGFVCGSKSVVVRRIESWCLDQNLKP